MNNSILKRAAPDWRTVISAVLIVLAFPPFDIEFLAWIALVPWFFALRSTETIRGALVQGLWLSFLMTLGGFSWVAYVLHEFGQIPWAVAILGLLLFGLICQPQFLIAGPLFTAFHKRFAPECSSSWNIAFAGVITALTYTGIDWILPKLFVDTIGHSFYESQRLRQLADLGGAHLITFVAVLVNYALWWLSSRLLSTRRQGVWQLREAIPSALPLIALAGAFAASGWTYGYFRLAEIREIVSKEESHLQAAVIQGNIGDIEKVAAEHGLRGAAERVISTLLSLSDQALSMADKPDVVIWPETSYPSTFRTPETPDELARDQWIERFVRDRDIPLLFGGYDIAEGKAFNSFFYLFPRAVKLLDEKVSDLQVYHKNILLLFGEYIPGMERVQFLKDLFPQIGNFGRGNGPDIFPVPLPDGRRVLTGPIICYEALFPNYVIGAARKGSQMILNITNDSWFGPYQEPQLHLALVTFRSIETRLPQLRSTNTGISALILPDGEIVKQTAIGRPEIMNTRVPLNRPIPTLMMKWGDWFGGFALAMGLFGAFLLLRRCHAKP